jgi:hypothetical protein
MAPQPALPWRDPNRRSDGEMAVLYGTSIAYGVGAGIWIDGVAGVSDPGLAFIAPIVFGGAVPAGLYLADHYYAFHRGVPESISTGMWLGAVEGIAIAGTQWQNAAVANRWGFGGEATATWLIATAGGVGGYAFGEWLRPDSPCGNWADGASIVGLIGYNVGLVATGAISIRYMPSWRSQAWMWGGFLMGTAASSVVYFGYIGSSDDPRHGLIANSLGGLAGVGIAAALTANMRDDNGTSNAAQQGSWTPPFQVAMQPVASPLYGSTQTKGAAVIFSGDF